MLMYQGYLETRYEALDDGCEAARSIPPPGTDDRTDVCDERWGRARKAVPYLVQVYGPLSSSTPQEKPCLS